MQSDMCRKRKLVHIHDSFQQLQICMNFQLSLDPFGAFESCLFSFCCLPKPAFFTRDKNYKTKWRKFVKSKLCNSSTLGLLDFDVCHRERNSQKSHDPNIKAFTFPHTKHIPPTMKDAIIVRAWSWLCLLWWLSFSRSTLNYPNNTWI